MEEKTRSFDSTSPSHKTRYSYKPARLFAKNPEKKERIIKTGLLYCRLPYILRKYIVSITNEPRLLVCHPSSNKLVVRI